MRLPKLIVHCDWGSSPEKRKMAWAYLEDGLYRVRGIERVGPLDSFLERQREQVGREDNILVGFDFPIGLPAQYAERAGINSFMDILPEIGRGEWDSFFKVAAVRDEISLRRPFYPYRPGGTCQEHLTSALGVRIMDELRRQCERGAPGLQQACPLFWTLGANQVGKAAIIGWRDVIIPALRSNPERIKIWPFNGSLETLLGFSGSTVIVETYPAAALIQLETPFLPGEGKRQQAARSRIGVLLLEKISPWDVEFGTEVIESLRDGFGSSPDGEDDFDAMVGLFGMLDVVFGKHLEGAPHRREVREIEGWILGRRS